LLFRYQNSVISLICVYTTILFTVLAMDQWSDWIRAEIVSMVTVQYN